MPHGVLTFITGIVFIILGLAEWPSSCQRGPTPPGVYETRRLQAKDVTHSYDHWTNQLQRQKDRGR